MTYKIVYDAKDITENIFYAYVAKPYPGKPDLSPWQMRLIDFVLNVYQKMQVELSCPMVFLQESTTLVLNKPFVRMYLCEDSNGDLYFMELLPNTESIVWYLRTFNELSFIARATRILKLVPKIKEPVLVKLKPVKSEIKVTQLSLPYDLARFNRMKKTYYAWYNGKTSENKTHASNIAKRCSLELVKSDHLESLMEFRHNLNAGNIMVDMMRKNKILKNNQRIHHGMLNLHDGVSYDFYQAVERYRQDITLQRMAKINQDKSRQALLDAAPETSMIDPMAYLKPLLGKQISRVWMSRSRLAVVTTPILLNLQQTKCYVGNKNCFCEQDQKWLYLGRVLIDIHVPWRCCENESVEDHFKDNLESIPNISGGFTNCKGITIKPIDLKSQDSGCTNVKLPHFGYGDRDHYSSNCKGICLGGFGNYIHGALGDGNPGEAMLHLLRYVKAYNPHDLLNSTANWLDHVVYDNGVPTNQRYAEFVKLARTKKGEPKCSMKRTKSRIILETSNQLNPVVSST